MLPDINKDRNGYEFFGYSDLPQPHYAYVNTTGTVHDRMPTHNGYNIVGPGLGFRLNRYSRTASLAIPYKNLLSESAVDLGVLWMRHGEFLYGYKPYDVMSGFMFMKYDPSTGAHRAYQDRAVIPMRGSAPTEFGYSGYGGVNVLLCAYNEWLLSMHLLKGEVVVRAHGLNNLDVHIDARTIPGLEWFFAVLDRYLAGLHVNDNRGWVVERAPHDRNGRSRKFYIWPRYPEPTFSVEGSAMVMYFDLDANYGDVAIVPGVQYSDVTQNVPHIVRPNGELVYFSGKRSVSRYDPYAVQVKHIVHGLTLPKDTGTGGIVSPRYMFSTDSSFVAYYYRARNPNNPIPEFRWAAECDFESHKIRNITGIELQRYVDIWNLFTSPDDAATMMSVVRPVTTASNTLVVANSDRINSTTTNPTGLYGYFHQLLPTDGLYYENKPDLGFNNRPWADMAALELSNNEAVLLPGAIVHKGDLDPVNVSEVIEGDEGKFIKVINGQPRKIADPGFMMAPAADEGQVLGVLEDGTVGAVSFPKYLPDWFDGCTPVVQPGGTAWQAGDALFSLPRVNRNNVVFISKDRRWEPAVLPFTTKYRTLEDAFDLLQPEYQLWYIYVDSALHQSISETPPVVRGDTAGLVHRLPSRDSMRLGIDPMSIALTGNLNNHIWDGTQDFFSNREIRNWDYVSNRGTGRWKVGDFMDSFAVNHGEESDSWFRVTDQFVVCRINNYEPGCVYGEEHKELYDMAGRFMARQFMKGAIPQDTPCRYEAEISTDPAFVNNVVHFDTSSDRTGWQFEHTDGGQSTFIPTGPAGTTVIGVVFDPYINGVLFDRELHHFRFRKTVGGVTSGWLEATMFDVYAGWFGSALVEDQRYVNHVVLPELADRNWVYTREPILPTGGAVVPVEVTLTAATSVSLQIQISDSILFTGEVYGVDRPGWFLDGVPYTGASLEAGDYMFHFDPAVAVVESRVGSRFVRTRWDAGDGFTKWKLGNTYTATQHQTRFDMLNVLGFERDRDQIGPITMVRDAPWKTVVTQGGTYDTNDVPDEKGNLYVTTLEDGPAVVLAHGSYEVLPDAVWKHDQAMSLASRRPERTPPMYETQKAVAYTDMLSTTAVTANNMRLRHPMGKFGTLTVGSGASSVRYVNDDTGATENSTTGDGGTSVDHIPGSRFVVIKRQDFISDNPLGVDTSTVAASARVSTAVSDDGRFVAYTSNATTPSAFGVSDLVLGTHRNYHMNSKLRGRTLTLPGGLFTVPSALMNDQLTLLDPRTGLTVDTEMSVFDEHKDLSPMRLSAYGVCPFLHLPGRFGMKYVQQGSLLTREYVVDDTGGLRTQGLIMQPDSAFTPNFETSAYPLYYGSGRVAREETTPAALSPANRHTHVADWGMAWLTNRRDPVAYVNAMGYRATANTDWSGAHPLDQTGEWLYAMLAGDFSVAYTTNMQSRLYGDSLVHSLLRGYTQAFNIDRTNSRAGSTPVSDVSPTRMLFAAATNVASGGVYHVEFGEPGSGLSDYRGETYARLAPRIRFGR